MADALNAIISAFSDQKFIEKMQSAIEHINDYAFENLDPRETPEIKGKFLQCLLKIPKQPKMSNSTINSQRSSH